MRGEVLLLGASGTIGRATARALIESGFSVVAMLRPGAETVPGCKVVEGSVTNSADVATMMAAGHPAAVISCLASRTGAPADSWAVDYRAHSAVLKAAVAAGVGQFVLLSAICVQKPMLEFQRAKLAFEAELMASGLTWSIVRATAFFKSLSGQVARVQAGKPFLVFGDGRQTACKPISDNDLGQYLALCLTDHDKANRILPIGGPGPAITPLDQVDMLRQLMGQPVRVRHVPMAVMDVLIRGLSLGAVVSPKLRAKAELARIGRYYATESMLVWDGVRYSAEVTPEFGSDRLVDHYAALLRGAVKDDLGAHAVF